MHHIFPRKTREKRLAFTPKYKDYTIANWSRIRFTESGGEERLRGPYNFLK